MEGSGDNSRGRALAAEISDLDSTTTESKTFPDGITSSEGLDQPSANEYQFAGVKRVSTRDQKSQPQKA